MAIGKGLRNSKNVRTDFDGERASENVSFKCFLFFFTGSQAVLWPWIPVILDKAGVSIIVTGITLCFANVAELIGIKLMSLWIKRTNNGSVRRLLLFVLYSASLVLSFASLFLLPTLKIDFCRINLYNFSENTELNQTNHISASSTLVPNKVINETFSQLSTTQLPHTEEPFGNQTSTHQSYLDKNESNSSIDEPISSRKNLGPTVKSVPEISEPSHLQHVATSKYVPPSSFIEEIEKNIHRDKQTTEPNINEIKMQFEDRHLNFDDKKENFERLMSSKNNMFSRKKYGHDKINIWNSKNVKHPDFSPFDYSYDKENIDPIYIDNEQLQGDKDANYNYVKIHSRGGRNKILRDDRRYKREISSEKDLSFLTNDEPHSSKISVGIIIALLLVFSFLLSGGVESSVSKVWFCIKYGLQSEIDVLDDLNNAIVPNFHISVLGHHRHWSLWTRSLWLILAVVSVRVMCEMSDDFSRPFIVLGIFHGLSGIMSCFNLLFIPMPHGSLQPSRLRRPLSLYLDNEVIREGLRRVSFHVWVLVVGVVTALPYFYNLWFLKQSDGLEGEIFLAQTICIFSLYFGEVTFSTPSRWLGRKLNIAALMIITGICLWMYCVSSFFTSNLWMKSFSLGSIGNSMSLLWTVIQKNALQLGNSIDQEQEAYASWICWKVGLSIGALVWSAALEMDMFEGSVRRLFFPALIFGMTTTTIFVLITIFTRQTKQGQRRQYHTLDLNCVSEDDSTEEEEREQDWLVKSAKRDGLRL